MLRSFGGQPFGKDDGTYGDTSLYSRRFIEASAHVNLQDDDEDMTKTMTRLIKADKLNGDIIRAAAGAKGIARGKQAP